ncbi:type II secretion system F family protein [Variovorax sp. PvP013]|jgi:tight adherence protein C|uniref:type II secretion system F family protein n=1 Tax=Variovorax sp. PvP013 TaxID=3156435 RepID=UPI003D1DE512
MATLLTSLDATRLMALSVALLAAAALLVAGLVAQREWRAARSRRVFGRAVLGATAPTAGPVPDEAGKAGETDESDDVGGAGAEAGAAGRAGAERRAHWLRTRWGRLLVADEDRRLIDQCGGPALRGQLRLLAARAVLATALPVAALGLRGAGLLSGDPLLVAAAAFVLGFMAPKWVLARLAAARRTRVAQELPMFVELLRLLQGVGLSLDQTLHVLASDFTETLPVLTGELAIANRQYAQGRSREHSLQRMATLHRDEQLADLVALLVQIDRHGGAVQEPLTQFGERLRERRRADLKAQIGRITVKMTGIMVTTLLPALVIVTAGPGFLAITRSLGALSK